jgi:hypothetical protein
MDRIILGRQYPGPQSCNAVLHPVLDSLKPCEPPLRVEAAGALRVCRPSDARQFLRGSASRAFRVGRFPCLSKPLLPSMFLRGWKKASHGARGRCALCIASSRPTTTRSTFSAGAVRTGSGQWEQLFGLPQGYTLHPKSLADPGERVRSRLAMLGNAWHVPVARLFVLGMLASCPTSSASSWAASS